MNRKLVLVFSLLFLGSVIAEPIVFAKPPTKRSSSSLRSSSSSRYSSPSKKSSSKPKPSSKPKSSSSSSKYGSPSKSSSSSSKYGTPSSKSTTSSRKSSSSSSSSKALANKKQASQRTYTQSQKATAPSKSSYKSSSGKTVKVRAGSKTVSTMRSKPSSYHIPVARESRISVHIHNNSYTTYHHNYGWYHSQPHYYVGGGYSSTFWWMMMDWNAERRARWFYHNQSNIEQSAYQKGMQDVQVAAEMAKLRTSGVAQNLDYVDPEFANDPSDMYSQEYVEAAYNPTVIHSEPSFWTALKVMTWLVIFVGVGSLAYHFMFRARYGE